MQNHPQEESSSSSSNSDSILASFFRDIRRGISFQTYARNIEMYLNTRVDLMHRIKERSSARGNLKKELDRDTMTWKVFLRGLEIIGARKLKIQLTLTDSQGQEKSYEKLVVFPSSYKTDLTPPEPAVIIAEIPKDLFNKDAHGQSTIKNS